MCLAIPGKILEVDGNKILVDYGGIKKWVNSVLVDVRVGEYVLVHAGYAISKMSEEDARATLDVWEEFMSIANKE